MLCGAESWGLALCCMEEQLSINNYSQSFYLCLDDGGGESYFLPSCSVGVSCWQRTCDSSNFLIQHFSSASQKNPHPGSSHRCLSSVFADAHLVGTQPVYCRFSWRSAFAGLASFWNAFEKSMWIDTAQSGAACGQFGNRHFSFSSKPERPKNWTKSHFSLDY